jgi:hypothetical protein
MMTVTVRYGVRSVTQEVPAGTPLNQIVNAPNTKAYLGYGDNVRALIEGVEMGLDYSVQCSTEVVLETRSNVKGS